MNKLKERQGRDHLYLGGEDASFASHLPAHQLPDVEQKQSVIITTPLSPLSFFCIPLLSASPLCPLLFYPSSKSFL